MGRTGRVVVLGRLPPSTVSTLLQEQIQQPLLGIASDQT
jgi:hypothetical protein